MHYEIIDFHTHPFDDVTNNICVHKNYFDITTENTITHMNALGVSRICGSVICSNIGKNPAPYENEWEAIADSNQKALKLKEYYGDFYIPGFHVHPNYVKESCDEIEKMSQLGIRLIGELVPYHHGWDDYSCKGFDEILDVAASYHMVVNFHSMNDDSMDIMSKRHPDTILVAAHPGDHITYPKQLERMRINKNYHLDLSGRGITGHGLLRRGINEFGPERFLYGSDYPVCNPAAYLGGVLLDPLITENEKKLILAGNAKRLLAL